MDFENQFLADSGRVQLNFSHQECERDRISKGPVLTTQPAISPLPVVFPTSRTFFLSPSTQTSGHRTNDSETGVRSSLQNRKSILTRSSKKCAVAEYIVNQPRSSLKYQTPMFIPERSYRDQQQQSSRSSAFSQSLYLCSHQCEQKQSPRSSSPHSKTSVPAVPYSPYGFDETTLSSPTYLQALLESPERNYKNVGMISVAKPIKYIKIHYGPSYPSSPKQQPLRTRSINIRSSNDHLFQQYQHVENECDYRKYLRSTRQNRINNQKQRITLIATIPDETIFMRGSATSLPPRPKTIYNTIINS